MLLDRGSFGWGGTRSRMICVWGGGVGQSPATHHSPHPHVNGSTGQCSLHHTASCLYNAPEQQLFGAQFLFPTLTSTISPGCMFEEGSRSTWKYPFPVFSLFSWESLSFLLFLKETWERETGSDCSKLLPQVNILNVISYIKTILPI